MTFYVIKTTAV